MRFCDIVKLYDDTKEEKVKKFFEDLLNTTVEVRLRVTDPRVNLYSCYGDITNDMANKIKSTFSEVKIVEEDSEIKVISSQVNMGVGFMFYNVKKENLQKIIDEHDKMYQEQLKNIKEKGIIF